jgi:hypothetical protein
MRSEAATATRKELLSSGHAEKLGVKKLNRYALMLECRTCGTSWSNIPGADGDFPRDFWRCPKLCSWW